MSAPARRDGESFVVSRRLWSRLDMLEHNARSFLRGTKSIMRALVYLQACSDETVEIQLVEDALNNAAEGCSNAGLVVSAEMARESARTLLPKQSHIVELCKQELESIHNTIEGELFATKFYRLNKDYVRYVEDVQIFGSDVADQFPRAIKDIEAGGKALAFGLGTSSVFHMMRVMEEGLKSLARPLGIPYAPSWESYLRQIETRISAKRNTKTYKWKQDEPFFRDMSGDLLMVKIAWRNPTMHIVRHYDQDEAGDVLRAVRRFMIRLAERFVEVPS